MRTVVMLLAGCEVVEPGDEDGVFSVEVGPDGGELAGGGLSLTIPAGALSETTELTLRVEGEPGEGALSSVYRFEPEGLVFDEWVHTAVTLGDDVRGTLMWSTLDDPDVYEEIGLAAGGLAEGETFHFSSSVVEEGSCAIPEPITVCNCRAGDEVADLLCVEDPSTGATCDIAGFGGSDGQACSGFGPRAVLESWCDCYDPQAGYLCPDPMEFQPSQQCPSDGGLNGYHGAVGDECSGYTVDNDLVYGQMQTCQTVTADTLYQSVGGTLEGCYESSARVAAPTAGDRCTTAKRDWNDACLDVLDGYGPGRTVACPGMGDPATVGSTFGAMMEAEWVNSAPAGVRLNQLRVPYANKDDCRDPTKASVASRGYGNIDLAEISLVSAGEVLIRIGEVKPITRSGLDLGAREVYECYVAAVQEAGRSCKKPVSQRSADENAFCTSLNADGKQVSLDPRPGVRWDLDEAPFPLDAHTCYDGLVGYTCP